MPAKTAAATVQIKQAAEARKVATMKATTARGTTGKRAAVFGQAESAAPSVKAARKAQEKAIARVGKAGRVASVETISSRSARESRKAKEPGRVSTRPIATSEDIVLADDVREVPQTRATQTRARLRDVAEVKLAGKADKAEASSENALPIAARRAQTMEGYAAASVVAEARTDEATSGLASSDIKIFQIYFQPHQLAALDPAFEPYDNCGKRSRLYEFGVFARLAQSEDAKGCKLWGAVSWKFGEKAGLTGKDFKGQIIANPGYDVYFCNPHEQNEALYHNMWLQGETSHPGFISLCTEVFEVAGLPMELLTSMQPAADFAAANYFVATAAFWKEYINFVSRVLIAADRRLSPATRATLYSATADQRGVHGEASYIPFIVERLFSVFLATDGRQFRARKIAVHPNGNNGNVHLKLLGEMKDVACRTKSKWMAACWINYRNLYLSTVNGEAWSRKYIKQITPTDITFPGKYCPSIKGAPRK